MELESLLSIGTNGKKWEMKEFNIWKTLQTIKRDYNDDIIINIINKIKLLKEFKVEEYGNIQVNNKSYPLFAIQSKDYDINKLNILITGGVHGYETSGVLGALNFIINKEIDNIYNYLDYFNFLIIPCISPWSYETINRWNYYGIDVNRSFFINNINLIHNNEVDINLNYTQEANLIMNYINNLEHFKLNNFIAHFDLHETTNSDLTIFSPVKKLRDGLINNEIEIIPDGFYVVTDCYNKQLDFQSEIINTVEKVTHIALPDDKNQLIEIPIDKFGVISLPISDYGLCAGLTHAKYVTTTEVYPDSPKSNNEICIIAQVAAICGGLNYIIKHELQK